MIITTKDEGNESILCKLQYYSSHAIDKVVQHYLNVGYSKLKMYTMNCKKLPEKGHTNRIENKKQDDRFESNHINNHMKRT